MCLRIGLEFDGKFGSTVLDMGEDGVDFNLFNFIIFTIFTIFVLFIYFQVSNTICDRNCCCIVRYD